MTARQLAPGAGRLFAGLAASLKGEPTADRR
jgi:hypothetical protein